MSIASEDRLCILPGCSVSPTTDFEDRFGVGGYDNIITVEDDDNLSIQNIASHGFYNLAREEDETSSEDVQSWDLHVDILDDDNRTGKWRSRKKIFRNLIYQIRCHSLGGHPLVLSLQRFVCPSLAFSSPGFPQRA